MKRVGIAELKDGLSQYVRAVEAGDTIEVTDRNRVIARIVPAEQPSITIRPPARPFAAIRDRRYEPLPTPVDILEILRQERADRDEPGDP
jgi:prevent-host-death family protein